MTGRIPQFWQPGAAACALVFLIATPVKLCHFMPGGEADARGTTDDGGRPPAGTDPSQPKRLPIAVAATLPQVLPPRRADHESLRATHKPGEDPHIRGAARQCPPQHPVAVITRPVAAWRHQALDLAPLADRDLTKPHTPRVVGRDRQPTGPPAV